VYSWPSQTKGKHSFSSFEVPECSSFFILFFFLLDYPMVMICATFKNQRIVCFFVELTELQQFKSVIWVILKLGYLFAVAFD